MNMASTVIGEAPERF